MHPHSHRQHAETMRRHHLGGLRTSLATCHGDRRACRATILTMRSWHRMDRSRCGAGKPQRDCQNKTKPRRQPARVTARIPIDRHALIIDSCEELRRGSRLRGFHHLRLQQHDIHPTILLPPSFRSVVSDRTETLRTHWPISTRGQPCLWQSKDGLCRPPEPLKAPSSSHTAPYELARHRCVPLPAWADAADWLRCPSTPAPTQPAHPLNPSRRTRPRAGETTSPSADG